MSMEQESVQSRSHPSPSIRLPSSHVSPPLASSHPSPHTDATQTLARQMSRVSGFESRSQAAPSGADEPAAQVCFGATQVSVPLHASPSSQSEAVVQPCVHMLLHTSPSMVFPSSQISPPPRSRNPSPHVDARHVPARQMSRVAGFESRSQAVPSGGVTPA